MNVDELAEWLDTEVVTLRTVEHKNRSLLSRMLALRGLAYSARLENGQLIIKRLAAGDIEIPVCSFASVEELLALLDTYAKLRV
jgi:hypothetical protein